MYSNKRSLPVSLLLLGIGLTACADDGKAIQREDEAPARLARADVQEAERVAGVPIEACSAHAVIGELDGREGDCSLPGAPSTPHWTRHRMFGDSTPDIAAWSEAPPGELQRYCSYQYVGSGPIGREHYDELFAAIDAYPGMALESVDLDCRSEAAQGNGLDSPAVLAPLAEAFLRAIQWIPGSMLRSTVGVRERVEVAILDTVSRQAAGSEQIQPVHEHGRLMAAIIDEITCADADSACANTIRHHLALPRRAASTDWVRGGDFGTMGDLATSIVAAVGHWRMDQLADPSAPKRLVINASLGWEPDASSSSNAPERALEQALGFAACNGALVIAAAGNVANPACAAQDTGPLAPASYQLVAAPDAAECARLGYAPLDPSAYPIFGEARPLVYAAGGVDGRDRPLLNGRPEAMPPLATYAAHASVATEDGYTTPLTGTSVSAAVVSATAGLLWSYAPELTPDQVMGLIYESGIDTGRSADFAFGDATPAVHRVSVCAAMSRLCSSKEDGRCPELDCADPSVPADGYLGGYFAAAHAAIADAGDRKRSFFGPVGEAPVCESTSWNEQVQPQPELPACPACGLDSPPPPDNKGTLYMTLESEYLGSVVAIILTTFDPLGRPTSFVLDPWVIESVNDPEVEVTEVELETGPVVHAILTFRLPDAHLSEEIAVW